jgi:hypothetical protein
MTSLQIRILAVLKVKGVSEVDAQKDLDLLEENLVDDRTTREAITEALDGLVAEGYLEEKSGDWTFTPKGLAAAIEHLS